MGGPRASTIRQIERGAVCCQCRNPLPPREDGGTGERLCLRCMEAKLITVTMAFSYDLATEMYRVNFLEKDGMTALLWSGRYKTQEPLYKLVNATYQPMYAERELERKLFATRRGLVRLRLSAGQYERLKKRNPKLSKTSG